MRAQRLEERCVHKVGASRAEETQRITPSIRLSPLPLSRQSRLLPVLACIKTDPGNTPDRAGEGFYCGNLTTTRPPFTSTTGTCALVNGTVSTGPASCRISRKSPAPWLNSDFTVPKTLPV